MKVGDTVKCKDAKDLLQTQKDLELAGFHTVVSCDGAYTLRITGVPETEYLVVAYSPRRAQHNYCGTLEEAKGLADEMLSCGYGIIEILKGYPGEWKLVDVKGDRSGAGLQCGHVLQTP